MNKKSKIFLLIILNLFPYAYTAIAADKLLHKSDLTYLGAFRVPQGDLGGPQYHGLSYGGSVIAYNSDHNSLFITGHDQDQLVAEISIPQPVKSNNLADLNMATALQNLSDVTEGNALNLKADGSPILVNGTKIGGLLKYGNNLIGSIYAYYDAGHEAVRSHFTSGLDLSFPGDFKGVYEVGQKPDPVPQAGFVGGYMTKIPSDWQSKLGGTALTGMSAISILGRTSSGPAAFAFNPDNLNALSPAQASPLLYYPIDHQTIGTYYTSQTLYNKGSHHTGVTFPTGTSSIIYTGRQGLGEACYGPGTNMQAENGNRYNYPSPNNTCMGTVMTDTEDPCCYDPENLNKGAHAYPYVPYVWAYDANDFARVKSGGKIIDDPSLNLVDGLSQTSTENYQPWDIKPYDHWQISFPYSKNGPLEDGAAAYDEVNRKLYVVQSEADGMRPVIHVFLLNINKASYSNSDFINLLPSWLYVGNGEASDLNFDAKVNSKDLGIMMSKWN